MRSSPREPTEQERWAWSQHARCAGLPDIMHPAEGDGPAEAEAQNVCRFCSVKAECLAWAYEHDEQEGVWGGLTAKQRRRRRGR